MKISQVSLDQTVSETSNNFRLQRVVRGHFTLFILHLSDIALLEGSSESFILERLGPDAAELVHLRVLKIDVRIVQLVEFVIFELIGDNVEAHVIDSIAEYADDSVITLRLCVTGESSSRQTLEEFDCLAEVKSFDSSELGHVCLATLLFRLERQELVQDVLGHLIGISWLISASSEANDTVNESLRVRLLLLANLGEAIADLLTKVFSLELADVKASQRRVEVLGLDIIPFKELLHDLGDVFGPLVESAPSVEVGSLHLDILVLELLSGALVLLRHDRLVLGQPGLFRVHN